MKDEIKTIAEQVDWRELKVAKFKLGYDDNELSLSIRKGNKLIKIAYVPSSDLYTVTKIKKINSQYDPKDWEVLKGIYDNQLKEIIEGFFPRFEYVIQGLKIVGVQE